MYYYNEILLIFQAAHKCLELMVEQVDSLFMVRWGLWLLRCMCACFSVQIPSDMIHVCQFSYLENANPVPHHELGQDRYGFGDFHSYINTCVNTTLKVLCDIQANQTIINIHFSAGVQAET